MNTPCRIRVLIIGPGFIRRGFFGNHVRFFSDDDITTRLISPGVEYSRDQPAVTTENTEIYQCSAIKGIPWRLRDWRLFLQSMRWGDVVHCYHTAYPFVLLCCILSWICRKPLVVTTTDHIVFRGGLYALTSHLAWKMADIVTAFSNQEREWLASQGVKQGKLRVIPLAIDNTRFQKHSRLRKNRERDTRAPLNLLFVGRKHPDKNLSLLIERFAAFQQKHPDAPVKLNLVGRDHDKPYVETLRNKIEELALGEYVELISELKDEDEFLRIFSQADIFIDIALLGSFELVVLEAMTMGIPVISSNQVGVAQVVEERESGILVDPSDPNEILAAIEKMVLTPEFRDICSENCIKHQDKYHYREMNRQLKDLYLELRTETGDSACQLTQK